MLLQDRGYVNPPNEQMVEVFARQLGWKNVYDVSTETLQTQQQSAK
jgi:hypothetical protein